MRAVREGDSTDGIGDVSAAQSWLSPCCRGGARRSWARGHAELRILEAQDLVRAPYVARPSGPVDIADCARNKPAVSLVSLIGGLAWAISFYWPKVAEWLTSDGQPMIWLNGISVWPTVFLRMAIWLLCIVLFIHAFRWLNKDFDRVASSMGVKEFWDKIEETERARENPPWTKFVRYFSYPMPEGTATDYKQRFWGRYIYQGTWPARIWRTVVAVAAFFVLWGILELVFGNPPRTRREGRRASGSIPRYPGFSTSRRFS